MMWARPSAHYPGTPNNKHKQLGVLQAKGDNRSRVSCFLTFLHHQHSKRQEEGKEHQQPLLLNTWVSWQCKRT